MFDYKKTVKYLIDSCQNSNQIVLFGAGANGKMALWYLEENIAHIKCFCDNQKTLQGMFIKNIPVLSPEDTAKQYPNALYVITPSNEPEKIKKQLIALTVKPEQIIIFNSSAKGYDYYKNLEEKYYEEEVQDSYYRQFRRHLNLNPPKTYNEKICWQKLYENDNRKTLLTDKFAVRDWVTEKIGEKYLNHIYGMWETPKEIPFQNLPKQYVLKLTHGCGWNIIITDKEKANEKEIKNKLEEWRQKNFAYYQLEMQYAQIKPRIICEEYLENEGGELYDYKVFCFHGKPEYIMFLTERQRGLKMAFYDTDWKKQPFVYSYPQYEKEAPKPECLDEMLKMSQKLSQDFDHVRVDWYCLPNGNLRFGEMTFTSCAGMADWQPPEYDEVFGKLI